MRASKYHLNTLKEAPTEAEVISHQLMTRAGMIRKLAGGIYTYMPLGLRVLKKIEAIIREEMDRAGAVELLMPMVQPAELWDESGRLSEYGPELLRIKDRHQRDFVLQPTSEEVVTDIARNEIQSWRQLPVNFYHIQTKFRDERRPRFGLMRGREFTMKDAYSFDRDEASAQASYDNMYDAYMRIFNRLGLVFRAVAADTGSIGGSRSHEFQVIANTGEDLIVYNPDSQYAANIELAEAPCLIASRSPASRAMTKVATPDMTKCEDVVTLMGRPLTDAVKSIVLATEPAEGKPARIFVLLIRADHELNEVKTGKLPGLDQGYRFATDDEIRSTFGCSPGYLGPVGTKKDVTVIADTTVANMHDFICGANEDGFHLDGVNWGRDLAEAQVADLRNVVAGDPDPNGGTLAIQRGIEVGHVFFLGDKYSKALNATFLETDGKPAIMQMGCYGIGVSRIAAAAIEQNHDERGIIWPAGIAPFQVVICPMGWTKSETVRNTAEQVYQDLLSQGVDVIIDDRDIRPGVMFAEWELIGVPLRLTIGDRGLKEGIIEYQDRRHTEAEKIKVEDASAYVLEQLKSRTPTP
ncbi:MAG: proline--tRNA ligase [Alcaligenaceae bacterium]|nr:proline--tRNA ligase [Alcaligenaceae bacterium]